METYPLQANDSKGCIMQICNLCGKECHSTVISDEGQLRQVSECCGAEIESVDKGKIKGG